MLISDTLQLGSQISAFLLEPCKHDDGLNLFIFIALLVEDLLVALQLGKTDHLLEHASVVLRNIVGCVVVAHDGYRTSLLSSFCSDRGLGGIFTGGLLLPDTPHTLTMIF